MQKFAELCHLYQSFRTRNRDYAMRAAQFVRIFAAELAKQIEAPSAFTLPDKNRRKVLYVRPLTFDPETGNVEPLGGPADYLSWDDNDGTWEAAVGIHLEPAKNAFPKTEFTVRLKFKLHDGDIDLQIPPEGNFAIKFDDRASWQPALEHMISALVRTLNLKPWERAASQLNPSEAASEQKKKIGFIWFD